MPALLRDAGMFFGDEPVNMPSQSRGHATQLLWFSLTRRVPLLRRFGSAVLMAQYNRDDLT